MAAQGAKNYDGREGVFPTKLRKAMKDAGISASSLANEIGITPQGVSLYTNGKAGPDWKTLCKIADFCGVSVDWLLGRTEYKKKDNETITAYNLGLTEKAAEILTSKRHLSVLLSSLIELEDDNTETGRPVLSLIDSYLYIKQRGTSYGDMNVFNISEDSDSGAISRVLEKVTYNHVVASALLTEAIDNIKAMAER